MTSESSPTEQSNLLQLLPQHQQREVVVVGGGVASSDADDDNDDDDNNDNDATSSPGSSTFSQTIFKEELEQPWPSTYERSILLLAFLDASRKLLVRPGRAQQ
jgi:hypothetical protein